MADYEFEEFMEEVGDILPLNSQNQQSLQKSLQYLESKIRQLEGGKRRFKQDYQLQEIQLLLNEIVSIKNNLNVKNS